MNYTNLVQEVTRILKEQGETAEFAMSTRFANNINHWTSLYEGKFSGKDQILGLPASISSEIARLITLESKIKASGQGEFTDLVQKTLDKIKEELRVFVEYGVAKGGLVFKPYITQGGIGIDFIQADEFIPISFDSNHEITQCAFASRVQRGSTYYTRIEFHKLKGSELIVRNLAFASSMEEMLGAPISLESVPEWSELENTVTIKNVNRLPFGYFRVPLANSQDSKSPLGISCFARAIPKIKTADKRYSEIDWEYVAKEAAVHVSEDLLDEDPTGKSRMPKGYERLYRKFAGSKRLRGNDDALLDVYSPEIRTDALLKGLNAQLRLIEFDCGLAYGTISDPQTVEKTATEIKIAKQRSYAFITDCQMALQKAIEQFVDAIKLYATLYKIAPLSDCELSFTWDDSIIVDSEQEQLKDMQKVNSGMMARFRYLMKWEGLSEEEAKQRVQEASEENDQLVIRGIGSAYSE